MKITDKDKLLADWLEGNITDETLQKQLTKEEYLQFLKIRNGFELLGKVEKSKKKIWNNLQTEIKTKPQQNNSRRASFKMAFSSVAAVLLLFLFIKIIANNKGVRFRNETAQNKILLLPDSSEVILFANAEIKYNPKKWHKKREVLLTGKAYFKVKKGGDFIVKTKHGIVKVVGTEFEVESNDHLFQVICFEGKVIVETTGKKDFLLTAGKGIAILNNRPEEIQTIWSEPEWLHHIYNYKRQSLGTVLNELSKIYHIRFDTQKIDTTTLITGGFPKDNLKLSLQTVLKPMGISYKKEGNLILLYSDN